MRRLFVLSLAVGVVALLLAQAGRDGAFLVSHAALPAVYLAAYLLLLIYLHKKTKNALADPILLAALIALTGIGLATLARIDALMVERQIRWFLLGIAGFGAAASFSIWDYVRRYRYVWAVSGLFLLVLTALIGVEVGGARSWIRVGSFQFQPIEIVKILLLFYLSAHLAEAKPYLSAASGGDRRWIERAYLGPLVAMGLLFIFVLVAQRDLGGALLLFGLVVTMLFAATGLVRYLVAGVVIALIGASLASVFFGHVRTRFLVWLDPWSYGRGYQIVESLFALGAGGIFGTGFGGGMADRIPAVETDFILALITEELGVLGGCALLFLLAVICVRSLLPSFDPTLEDVERLGVLGVALLLALQSGLIVAGVTRLLPVTGVTLPFVSYGGSSLVASFLQLGLVYNRVRETHRAPGGAGGEPVEWSEA